MPSSDSWSADQRLFAAGLLDPDLPVPAGVVGWNDTPPAKRYAVHRNNVVGGLIDALAETFPATVTLVGTDFFRAAAALFVRHHPPRSALLLDWGGALPAFLAAFPPAASVPYLADIAALEWAMTKAFHAADAAPLPVTALAEVPAVDLEALQLVLHPSLRLLTSRFPAVSIWGDLNDRNTRVDMTRGEDALVIRPDLRVDVTALPPGALAFLSVLARGDGLGLAAPAGERAAAEKDSTFDLGRHLAGLFQAGCFIALNRRRSAHKRCARANANSRVWASPWPCPRQGAGARNRHGNAMQQRFSASQ